MMNSESPLLCRFLFVSFVSQKNVGMKCDDFPLFLCGFLQPKDRPSASQLVSIASAPEFVRLTDVVSLNPDDQASPDATALHCTVNGAASLPVNTR